MVRARALVCVSKMSHRADYSIHLVLRPTLGVYKSGFASTQDAYEEAVVPLFKVRAPRDSKGCSKHRRVGSRRNCAYTLSHRGSIA